MEKEVTNQLIESNIKLATKTADLVKILKQSEETNIILSKKLTQLLTLFETATKTIKENKEVDPLIKHIDNLTKQNRDIAKSLIMIERSLREQTQFSKPMR